jgi:hypothetical protein
LSFVTGYQDSGSYNVTVVVNDSDNVSVSVEWLVTVEDTYPIPSAPVGFSPSGGQYEYSIPLTCVIDSSNVQPYHFEYVYRINSSMVNYSMNINDSDGFYMFDISNDAYLTNYTFGCRVVSPAGTGNYTYSSTFTKVNKNNFYLFYSNGDESLTSMQPYTLGMVSELTNSINASIAANLADCNGDGLWDYSYDYRGLNYTSSRQTFQCVNTRGTISTTIGMVLFKNNTYSWESLNCNNLKASDNYCVVYKTYEVMIK